jgi:transposase
MRHLKGLKRNFDQLQQRRFRAAKLFSRGLTKAEVAHRLEVSAQSAGRWHALWEARGVEGLRKAGRAGRKPRLDADQLQELEVALRQGPRVLGYDTPLWTAPRIADLIHRQTGVRFHADHVYRLLQKLGWSCQRPVGRALERDERAIRRWKQQRWPDIKKKRCAKTG